MSPMYEDEFDDGPGFMPFGNATRLVLKRMARSIDVDAAAEMELEEAISSVDEMWHIRIKDRVKLGLSRCESPIEKLILPWLVCQEYRLFRYNPQVLLPGESAAYVQFTVAIIPQLPISGFRVDFALATGRGGPIRFIVVECDGAEFHDKPNQVVRDVNRDVKILANDRVIGLLRLSGAEIHKSPKLAAAKAVEAVVDAWAVNNKSLDDKFSRSHAGSR